MILAIRQVMDRLRAGMFDVVEVADLAPKQEKAAKGLLRKLTYDAQTDLEAAARSSDG